MKKNFRHNLLVFSLTLIAACSGNDNDQPRIRIVDLEGNSHSVVTKVPELNMQAMAMQGRNPEPVRVYDGEQKSPPPSYGNLIEQTLQIPQSPSQVPTQQTQVRQSATPTTPDVEQAFVAPDNQQTIEYDLVSPQEDSPKSHKEKHAKNNEVKDIKESATALSTNKVKGLFVQVGSFSSHVSAEEVLNNMRKFHKGHIEVSDDERKLYRVLLGPFKTKPSAQKLLNKIKASGHDAVLKRNN